MRGRDLEQLAQCGVREVLGGGDLHVPEELARALQQPGRVEDHVPSWVEPYPNCGGHSVVSVLGERSTVEEIKLSDLLSMIVRTGPG